MCERATRAGAVCTRPSVFMVFVPVTPQALADGSVERSPAGRSQNVCHAHVIAVVRELWELPIRTYGAAPTVRPI